MIAYVITSLAWSLVGFALGYASGRTIREVHQIKEAVVPEHAPPPPPPRRRPGPPGQVFGIILIVLAVGSVILMAKSITSRQSEIECRAQVLSSALSTLEARGQVAGQDRDALDRFMADVFRPDVNAATARRAYLTYTRAIAANSEERAELTYPEDDC